MAMSTQFIFGIRKFYQYLYGNSFTLVTDHKPLTSILNPSKGLPAYMAARLQRWAVYLMGFSYTIQYRSTDKHANCDALSRLPIDDFSVDDIQDGLISQIVELQQCNSDGILDFKEVASKTSRDPILRKVRNFVQMGWPSQFPSNLKPYYNIQAQLSVQSGCLMVGSKVVVPQELRPKVLKLLHMGHVGMTKTSMLARNYFFWPRMHVDVKLMVAECKACQVHANAPKRAPLHPMEPPCKPWERINIDFAGPFKGRNYLLVVDVYSRWIEVIDMKSTTAVATVHALRALFFKYGIPLSLVSDNGAQFTSAEFRKFMRDNRVYHIFTAPYHPSSNGAVERYVQTFKRYMKTALFSGEESMDAALRVFLLNYRCTPHAVTKLLRLSYS